MSIHGPGGVWDRVRGRARVEHGVDVRVVRGSQHVVVAKLVGFVCKVVAAVHDDCPGTRMKGPLDVLFPGVVAQAPRAEV